MKGWIEALSRHMEAGVLLVDTGGDVQLVSEGAVHLLDLSPDDVRDDWPRLRRRMEEQTGDDLWSSDELELEAELTGGRRLRVKLLRVDESDCRGHLILLRDGRRAQSVERDQALTSQMRSMAHVYRSMAHDLRAPLNAMVVNLELLSNSVDRGMHGGLKRKGQGYVAVLKEETDRLHRYLETYLSQTAPPGERRRRFDLAEHLRRMSRFIAPQAQHQKTELILDLPGEPVEIEGNPDHLRQAILSLLVNALEAVEGREGGRVELGLAEAGAGDAVRLWVSDDGPGVDPEVRDEIFRMHVTSKEEGSGLGLPVARRIAREHGGSLHLEPGGTGLGGAHFELILPRPGAAAHQES